MARYLIVESETPEEIARFGRCLAAEYGEALRRIDASIEFEIATPYVEPLDAAILSEFDAVAFPGSGVDWSTDAPQARPLRDAMEAVFSRGLPSFGSCNGMQLAAVVLGGKVGWASELEVGLARDVQLSDAGRNHPMMAQRPASFSVPAIHRDQVTNLPDGAIHLAGNQHTPNQAFAYQRDGVDFWGVQYHPEYTLAEICRSLVARPEMFADYLHLLDDFQAAEQDAVASARLGTSVEELAPPQRDSELRQWMAGIGASAAA